MTRVWILQCLCPQRHAIMALAAEAVSQEDAEQQLTKSLADTLERYLAERVLNPWCGICRAPHTSWIYELGRTRWRTLDEAAPRLKQNETEQLATAAVMGELFGARKFDA